MWAASLRSASGRSSPASRRSGARRFRAGRHVAVALAIAVGVRVRAAIVFDRRAVCMACFSGDRPRYRSVAHASTKPEPQAPRAPAVPREVAATAPSPSPGATITADGALALPAPGAPAVVVPTEQPIVPDRRAAVASPVPDNSVPSRATPESATLEGVKPSSGVELTTVAAVPVEPRSEVTARAEVPTPTLPSPALPRARDCAGRRAAGGRLGASRR